MISKHDLIDQLTNWRDRLSSTSSGNDEEYEVATEMNDLIERLDPPIQDRGYGVKNDPVGQMEFEFGGEEHFHG